MKKEFEPGSRIFVVERGIDGVPRKILTCCFLAQLANAAIISPSVCYTQDQNNLENISRDLIPETARYKDCTLSVFPLRDCFSTQKEAENSLRRYPLVWEPPSFMEIISSIKEPIQLDLEQIYSVDDLKGVDSKYEK